MKQDCAVSQSTADEIKCFQTSENNAFLKGTYVSEPDEQTGSVVKKCPVKMAMVGQQDTFGESGKPDELREKYGMTAADIVRAAIGLMEDPA